MLSGQSATSSTKLEELKIHSERRDHMAVFRVEKTKNYTIMSNHHLRNAEMSLKAKGLMSLMLSLPENWDYTLAGLAYISKDGLSSIRAAVGELEQHGYLKRRRLRNEMGQLTETEYTIMEIPENIDNHKHEPICDFPTLEKPTQGKPTLENPTQLNIDTGNKELYITDPSIHQSANQRGTAGSRREKPEDRIDRIEAYRAIIMENIDYHILLERYDQERLDELVEIMLEAVCSIRDYLRVAGSDMPTEVVRSRMLKLNSLHIEYVFDALHQNTTKVNNIKSYLLTTLYNAPVTIGNYYSAEVNHDLYGK